MGICTQKRMALTDSRRLLALSYHHFPEQARGSVFRVRGLTGNSFDDHFFFFAAHFSAAFFFIIDGAGVQDVGLITTVILKQNDYQVPE